MVRTNGESLALQDIEDALTKPSLGNVIISAHLFGFDKVQRN